MHGRERKQSAKTLAVEWASSNGACSGPKEGRGGEKINKRRNAGFKSKKMLKYKTAIIKRRLANTKDAKTDGGTESESKNRIPEQEETVMIAQPK